MQVGENTRFTLVPVLDQKANLAHCLTTVEGVLSLPCGLGDPPMSTHGTAAYGIYSRNTALPEVVCALNDAGFDNQEICMVLSPAHPDAAAVRDASVLGDSSGKSASARMIRWFSEFGAVFIPTVGFFVRSETFISALASDQHLPKLSRGSHTLLNLGFSPEEARRLGQQLADIGALVYIPCKMGIQASGIIDLLRKTGAREAASLTPGQAAAAAA